MDDAHKAWLLPDDERPADFRKHRLHATDFSTEAYTEHMHEPEHDPEASHPAHEKNYHPPKPYWRRMHTHWAFWVAVVFLFAALFIYIFSYDLILVPHK